MNFLKLYLKERKQKTTNTSEDVGKVKTDFSISGSKNSYSHYKNQFGDSFEKLDIDLFYISGCHSGAYTQRTRYPTPERLLYSQYLGN